ncbi:SpaA isopeptide-forming pilin-related protein [Amycolatopsis sp. H20-H5]|uniref:SpaA isopeptide-forming pilin-related protein n=1 Tax=Amycolatopsis sp. H20-H5 TaxID=3046309 RepID=UPI002DB980EF|nr:SpaA isopeptide-forming pilin-related protein [Amycolatopsis sp. H20-H5]MEC3979176.1 SpaA isopeptide-forming pilin-related protein [Amycolatopsis sp. H20-H5]
MTKSPGARPISRFFAALAVALALTGTFAGSAAADPDPAPASTVPSTVPSTAASTAPSIVEPPRSSTAPESSAPPVESSKPAEPKPQAAPAERSTVEVSLVFDKKSYNTNEDVRFTFKVTNVGTTRAEGLTVGQTHVDSTNLRVSDWGPLQVGKGLALDPGATYELAASGKIQDIEQDTTVVQGVMFDKSGMSASQEFSFSARVTNVAGHAAGLVYGDGNGNGKLDDGEELGGIALTLRYVNGSATFKVTSGAKGKFDFGTIPSAEYYLGGDVVGGWLIPFETVQIGPDTKDLNVRGVPPLNGALHASMAFAKDTYQVGDLAHVTVTLSNSGKIPLTGIVAACNRVGNDYILRGTGPGWGDLVWSRGVTIAPGQTRTFDVSETVPEAAFNRGYVAASCDFGYREVDTENHADAHDQATVPGGFGALIGDVEVHSGQGLAGVKVVLTAEQACPVVGEQTTDEKGHFEFHKLVPGLNYSLYFLPPAGWKIKYDNPTSVDVYAPEDRAARVGIEVVAGDAPLPTVPTQSADCGKTATPTPTPGTGGGQASGSGLASTGVDVIGLGALALAALGLGTGLLLRARRRRIAG